MYLRIDLRPSIQLKVARTAFHIVALGCLSWIDIGSVGQVTLALLVVVSLIRFLQYPTSQAEALLFIDGNPYLLFEGSAQAMRLSDFYCTPFLQILHFHRRQMPCLNGDQTAGSAIQQRAGGSSRHASCCVVILPDATDKDARRRLRTLLRWYQEHSNSQSITTDC